MSCRLGSRRAEGEISGRWFFENKAGSPVGWDWTAASRPAPRGDGWGYFVA